MGLDDPIQDFWILEYDKSGFVKLFQPFINPDFLSDR